MRLSQLVFLFVMSASTSASVLPLLGIAGKVAVGKSFAGLLGASLIPAGVLFPLAAVGSLKALIGVKALGLMKLKLKAPIVAPVSIGVAGKIAIGHFKAHLVKTAVKAKAALIDLPLKLVAMKAGAVHGAIAGGTAGLTGYENLPKASIDHPDVIPASVLLSQPMPEPVPQADMPSYGQKAPAYSPPAPAYSPPARVPASPAYVPASPAVPAYGTVAETLSRRRRELNTYNRKDEEERVMAEIFDYLSKRDIDQCGRRSICAIAVQPDLALSYGPGILQDFRDLRDDDSAPWYPFKQAMAIGEKEKTQEACSREYPTCTKSLDDIVTKGVRQIDQFGSGNPA